MKPLDIEAVGLLSPVGGWAEFSAALAGGLRPQGAISAERLAEALRATPLRRAPRLARLALAAAARQEPLAREPLAQEPLAQEALAQEAPAQEALVMGVYYGSVSANFEFLDSLLNDGAGLASPTAFAQSVSNMPAALLNQSLRLTGPTLTLTNAGLTGALEAASALLAAGLARTVLLGAAAELSPIMDEAERRVGAPWSAPVEGAVFFRLGPAKGPGGRLRLTGAPRAGAAPADDFWGRGPLASAFRLAAALAGSIRPAVFPGEKFRLGDIQ